MFGFSTPAHAQTRLAAQQPRSSAPTSSTNVVYTTSGFETWRWPLSRLSSSQRPPALAHQPGSHSSASPRALRQNSRCHTPRGHGVAAVPRQLFTPSLRRDVPPRVAPTMSGEMSAAPPSPSRKDTFKHHNGVYSSLFRGKASGGHSKARETRDAQFLQKVTRFALIGVGPARPRPCKCPPLQIPVSQSPF